MNESLVFRYLKLYQVIFLTMPQQLLLALSSKSIQNTKSPMTSTVSIMAQTITVLKSTGLDLANSFSFGLSALSLSLCPFPITVESQRKCKKTLKKTKTKTIKPQKELTN